VTQLDGGALRTGGASTDLQLLGDGRSLALVTWTPEGGRAEVTADSVGQLTFRVSVSNVSATWRSGCSSVPTPIR
jgi:hypothetical protein